MLADFRRHRPHCHGWYHWYLRVGRIGLDCKRFGSEGFIVHWIHSARGWSLCRSGWYGSWVSDFTFGHFALIFELTGAGLPLVLSVMQVFVARLSSLDSMSE